jgi:hypothetical protein
MGDMVRRRVACILHGLLESGVHARRTRQRREKPRGGRGESLSTSVLASPQSNSSKHGVVSSCQLARSISMPCFLVRAVTHTKCNVRSHLPGHEGDTVPIAARLALGTMIFDHEIAGLSVKNPAFSHTCTFQCTYEYMDLHGRARVRHTETRVVSGSEDLKTTPLTAKSCFQTCSSLSRD